MRDGMRGLVLKCLQPLKHIGNGGILSFRMKKCICQIWVYDAEDTDEYECVALLQSHSQDPWGHPYFTDFTVTPQILVRK